MGVKVVPEIVEVPADVLHEPTVRILVRGGGWELIHTSAYHSQHQDRWGKYQVRQKATVTFRAQGSPVDTGLLLWQGAFSYKRMEDHPDLAGIASRIGIDPMTMMAYIQRRRTVIVETP